VLRPYVHPKLSAVDLAARDGGPIIVEIVKFSQDKPGERE
jgi:hypothetical protein